MSKFLRVLLVSSSVFRLPKRLLLLVTFPREAVAAGNFKGPHMQDSVCESDRETERERSREPEEKLRRKNNETLVNTQHTVFHSLFSIHSLKHKLWCCDIMNCIKLLLISCRLAERWITVRGLSYICYWPLSTSVELSTPWWPAILLIRQQLVMLHTWQLLDDDVTTMSPPGDNRTESSVGFSRLKYSDCQQWLTLIRVNATSWITN